MNIDTGKPISEKEFLAILVDLSITHKRIDVSESTYSITTTDGAKFKVFGSLVTVTYNNSNASTAAKIVTHLMKKGWNL